MQPGDEWLRWEYKSLWSLWFTSPELNDGVLITSPGDRVCCQEEFRSPSAAAHLCKEWPTGAWSLNDLVLSRKTGEPQGFSRMCTRVNYHCKSCDWRLPTPCSQLQTDRKSVQEKFWDPAWAEKGKLMRTGDHYGWSCKVGRRLEIPPWENTTSSYFCSIQSTAWAARHCCVPPLAVQSPVLLIQFIPSGTGWDRI